MQDEVANAGNDPVNLVDPDGLAIQVPVLAVVAIVAAVRVIPKIVGKGGLVAKEEVRREAKQQIKDVNISKSKHPESAKHISDSVKSGKSNVLTVDRANAKSRRQESLKNVETKKGYDRDEYPPAMFKEGGEGASVRHISPSDNRGAGSCIGHQCRGLPNGSKVKINVVD